MWLPTCKKPNRIHPKCLTCRPSVSRWATSTSGATFQLIDDLLDFTSCEQVMGKPTAADLKLGLATAPVLFAARRFPELNPMIMRRFSEKGDVETARDLVAQVCWPMSSFYWSIPARTATFTGKSVLYNWTFNFMYSWVWHNTILRYKQDIYSL